MNCIHHMPRPTYVYCYRPFIPVLPRTFHPAAPLCYVWPVCTCPPLTQRLHGSKYTLSPLLNWWKMITDTRSQVHTNWTQDIRFQNLISHHVRQRAKWDMPESHRRMCYLNLPTLFLAIKTLCQIILCQLHYVLHSKPYISPCKA